MQPFGGRNFYGSPKRGRISEELGGGAKLGGGEILGTPGSKFGMCLLPVMYLQVK
jgi:hypothetical protein